MFLSSLSFPVYFFLSLNVCLGMLVFLEPFLNGGLWFSRKANRTHGKRKDEVSPRVIEVTSSVDFPIPGRHLFHVMLLPCL